MISTKTKIMFGTAVISLALPFAAFAQTATSTIPVKQKPDIVCVQAAIEKRDSSIITGHNAFNTSIVAALTARKDSLKLAWTKEVRTEREEAKKKSYTDFRTSTKSAHEALRTVRSTSWKTFESDMKVCKVPHAESPVIMTNPTSTL
jgi:hypothetical protein